MQHDEFIGQVQARARLDSRGAGEQATRATLETLAQRLAGGLPSNLASQLPPEIGLHLTRSDDVEQFGLQEFYERVAERQSPGTDLPQAAFHARVVLSVLDEALQGDLLGRVKDQLPDEYRELFSFGDIEAPS